MALSVFENRYRKSKFIKRLVVKDMVVKHPVLGSMFVYDNYFDRNGGDSCYAVAWTADRRANWYMRLKNHFRTADSAFAWLNAHLHRYQPNSNFLDNFKKVKRPRDSQKKKVYKWEDDMAEGISHLTERLNHDQTLAFIHELYGAIGVPEKARPAIWMREGRTAYYWFERHILKLPVWARTRLTIIHEIAHNVMDWAYGVDSYPIHGAMFVKTYLELLFLVTNDTEQKYILDTCGEHGVRYIDPNYKTFDEPKFQSSIRRRLSRN